MNNLFLNQKSRFFHKNTRQNWKPSCGHIYGIWKTSYVVMHYILMWRSTVEGSSTTVLMTFVVVFVVLMFSSKLLRLLLPFNLDSRQSRRSGCFLKLCECLKRSMSFCVSFSKTKTDDILSGNHPSDAWEYPAGLCEWHAGTGRSAFVAQLRPSAPNRVYPEVCSHRKHFRLILRLIPYCPVNTEIG